MIGIDTTIIKDCKKEKEQDIIEDITIWDQVLFFVPLGLTSLLISMTHSLFNAALARLPSPEISLSAFTVAKSLMQVIQNPVAMVKQTVTALINDSNSYKKVRRFVTVLVASVVIFFAILVFSGGAKWILKNLMNIHGKVLDEAITILKIFIIFPAAVSLRNFMQGIAIKFRKTPLVTLATFFRVGFVAIIVVSVHKLSFIPPSMLAGLMFVGAIIVESVAMFLGVKIPMKNIPRKLDMLKLNKVREDTKVLNNRIILTFFAPLVITSFINSLSRPMIDSGLARTISPEIAISAYAVAWGLGIIIVSPLMSFHQVPLNFIIENNESHIKSVKKFATYTGITLSTTIAIMSFTPLGNYILLNIIGVSETISSIAIDVLKIMSLLPLVMVIRQYYWGIFMKNHKTKYISTGKIVNLIALVVTIFVVNLLHPSNPAIVGIISKISSEVFETLYLFSMRTNGDGSF